jgi:hypothetical protein
MFVCNSFVEVEVFHWSSVPFIIIIIFFDELCVFEWTGNVIEVGCGPFTQLKYILALHPRNVKSATLVDPLLLFYFRDVSGETHFFRTLTLTFLFLIELQN